MRHTLAKLHNRLVPFVVLILTGILVSPSGVSVDCGKQPPIACAAELAQLPSTAYQQQATPDSESGVTSVRPAHERARHLALLGVDRWHRNGYRGQGVKIAILDSGFRDYRDHLGQALPERVTSRSFRLDGDLEAKDSQHGILCGEVIHALAPEAELLFANWEPDSPRQFLEAVRWARRQGAHVISCSLIMPSWSDGEGGGEFDEALAKILGDGRDRQDVLFFASAGNTAQRHWSGRFRADRNGKHQWQPGVTANPLTPWGTDPISVELYGPSISQFEVHVFEEGTGKEVGQPVARNGRREAWNVVRFVPRAQTAYEVEVHGTKAAASPFHLVVLGGGLEYVTAKGSIPCPADCPRVAAVGAVSSDGRRLAYSCCGPNSRCPKPDFVAPVPFPSFWRNRPFSGTSAAAPQAAALGALCWSRHPAWSAEQIRRELQASAKDLGPPGHDDETGYGLILAPRDSLASPRSMRPVSMAP
jgi:subtilisin family serine protease